MLCGNLYLHDLHVCLLNSERNQNIVSGDGPKTYEDLIMKFICNSKIFKTHLTAFAYFGRKFCEAAKQDAFNLFAYQDRFQRLFCFGDFSYLFSHSCNYEKVYFNEFSYNHCITKR